MGTLFIEDHVVPQLFTSAIEAYEFEHRAHKNGKAYTELETFGLLWGYSIPQKDNFPAKIISTMSTIETSATRHNAWVKPDFESILAKKKFFERYWPNIELVGTFHSHPYANLAEVNENTGWRASPGDKNFWPCFHENIAPEQPILAHIVVTITKLQKRGWAYPGRLDGSEKNKGYVLSADNRKLWLRSYSSEMKLDKNNNKAYVFNDGLDLEIPSLQNRFW